LVRVRPPFRHRIARMIARIAFFLALAVPVPLVVTVWMLT
jgi:hypothetical protein